MCQRHLVRYLSVDRIEKVDLQNLAYMLLSDISQFLESVDQHFYPVEYIPEEVKARWLALEAFQWLCHNGFVMEDFCQGYSERASTSSLLTGKKKLEELKNEPG